jgi:hypothetical protein
LFDFLLDSGINFTAIAVIAPQKLEAQFYLKCRLEGTLGFTSEMKGYANIKQHFDRLSVHTSTHFDKLIVKAQ